jgi:hypothetical protein
MQYSVRALWQWISVQIYRRSCAGNECIEVSDLYKVARQYKETLILFLNPHFPWFCAHFISSTDTSMRTLNFPGIYIYICVCVCARARARARTFYPILWSCFQVEYKLAKCYHFKYFHLDVWKKAWFSVIISYVIYCVAYDYYFVTSESCHQHRAGLCTQKQLPGNLPNLACVFACC